MHKMADVRPPPAVALGQLYDVAMHRSIGSQPQFVDLLGRLFALLVPRSVQGLLEACQHHLPEHRGETVFDLAAQEAQANAWLRVALLQALERKHLAED